MAAIAAFAGPPLAAAPVSCQPPDRTLFTCPSGVKRIAVCATKGPDGPHSRLQYRFGPAGEAELAVPPRAGDADVRGGVSAGRGASLRGGVYLYMRFVGAGDYRYIVYSASGGDFGARSGVVVEKGERRIVVRRCDRGRDGEFSDDLFEGHGLPQDGSGFELPE